MTKRYSDDELSAILQKELRQALGSSGTEISQIRLRNLQFYKGEAEGELAAPDIEDRSSLVATDVGDTVEWMLPSLLRIFAASKDSMTCSAKHFKHAAGAKMVSEYLRWLFWKKNKGFHILAQWFKDAMIQKVGFLKVSWEEFEEDFEESYKGLLETQVAEILQDPDVTPTAVSSVTQMMDLGDGNPQPVEVYSIDVKSVKKKGRCRVAPCPPEEMRIHPRARYGEEFPFIAHEFYRSKADLEADGYDLTNVSGDHGWSQEEIERVSSQSPLFHDDSDGELQQYRVAECYIKLDQDKDGIPEWLQVVMIGDTVMTQKKVDQHPFVYFCPAPMPHTFFGDCPADWAIQPQRLRTSLLRSLADNVYATVNQRNLVLDNEVNMSDLLDSRPNGIVRVSRMDAVVPLPPAPLSPGAWSMVEWAEQWRESRTGFTRQSNGLNPDDLTNSNVGSMGVISMAERADQRIELIARHAAQSVEQLFTKMLRCVSMYQNVPEMVEIAGQWGEIDPRDWHKQYDIEVNVGLGVGSKEKQGQMLGQLLNVQKEMIMGGMIDPSGAVTAAKNMAEFMGLPNPEQYFPPAQPKPPGPSPEEIKGQMQMQVEQLKAQLKAQADAEKAELQAQVELSKQQSQQAQAEAQQQIELARKQYEAELQQIADDKNRELEVWKAELESNTRIAIAQIGAQSKPESDVAPGESQTEEAKEPSETAQMIAMISQVVEKLSQPRTVIRGADGRISGVQ